MPLEIQNVLIPTLLSLGLLSSLWLSLTIKMETRKRETDLNDRVCDLEARLTRIDFESKHTCVPTQKLKELGGFPQASPQKESLADIPHFAYQVQLPKPLQKAVSEGGIAGTRQFSLRDPGDPDVRSATPSAEDGLTIEQVEFLASLQGGRETETRLIAG